MTYDLSAMKHDNDHEDADLTWTIVKSDTCDYENYFSATISGDDISFDLIKMLQPTLQSGKLTT